MIPFLILVLAADAVGAVIAYARGVPGVGIFATVVLLNVVGTALFLAGTAVAQHITRGPDDDVENWD